jgi:hypothetical protein
VVDLQQDKDAVELKLMTQIRDLEAQTHKCVVRLVALLTNRVRLCPATERPRVALFRLHVRLHDLSQQLQTTKREQMHREQEAVEVERSLWKERVADLQRELDQEKNDKEAQKRWRTKFTETSSGSQPLGEPLEDALAKFAQSIALLPASVAPAATQAGVLPFLVHLLRENVSDVVTGSVLLALVHLAIYQKPRRISRYGRPHVTAAHTTRGDITAVNVKDEIIKAGAAAPLAHILETVRNQRVLTEGARLCAALSSFIPNKRVLAAKNTVRFLIQILMPGALAQTRSASPENADPLSLDTQRLEAIPIEIVPELQRFALAALVNLSHGAHVSISLPFVSVFAWCGSQTHPLECFVRRLRHYPLADCELPLSPDSRPLSTRQ